MYKIYNWYEEIRGKVEKISLVATLPTWDVASFLAYLKEEVPYLSFENEEIELNKKENSDEYYYSFQAWWDDFKLLVNFGEESIIRLLIKE